MISPLVLKTSTFTRNIVWERSQWNVPEMINSGRPYRYGNCKNNVERCSPLGFDDTHNPLACHANWSHSLARRNVVSMRLYTTYMKERTVWMAFAVRTFPMRLPDLLEIFSKLMVLMPIELNRDLEFFIRKYMHTVRTRQYLDESVLEKLKIGSYLQLLILRRVYSSVGIG